MNNLSGESSLKDLVIDLSTAVIDAETGNIIGAIVNGLSATIVITAALEKIIDIKKSDDKITQAVSEMSSDQLSNDLSGLREQLSGKTNHSR